VKLHQILASNLQVTSDFLVMPRFQRFSLVMYETCSQVQCSRSNVNTPRFKVNVNVRFKVTLQSSRAGPLQGYITILKLQSVTQLDTMVKSTMTGTVTSK